MRRANEPRPFRRVRRLELPKLPTERPISAEHPITTVPLHGSDAASEIAQSGEGQELREVVKARTIAGAVCITLPKELREALGIGAKDRVMVQLDKAERRLIVTKE